MRPSASPRVSARTALTVAERCLTSRRGAKLRRTTPEDSHRALSPATLSTPPPNRYAEPLKFRIYVGQRGPIDRIAGGPTHTHMDDAVALRGGHGRGRSLGGVGGAAGLSLWVCRTAR